MLISVYSSKGSAGKTPISANIVFDKDFCVGTNEAFYIYDNLIGDNKILSIEMEQSFPKELKDEDIDMVFDLAGSISKSSHSITSAIKLSDVVLVPVYNEYKSLVGAVNTINQIHNLNNNIIVVATKLQKQKCDMFKLDWTESEDFKNIKKVIESKTNVTEILPLKFSKVFDNIFEEKKSIKQIMDSNALAKYSYKDVAEQFERIYKSINI